MSDDELMISKYINNKHVHISYELNGITNLPLTKVNYLLQTLFKVTKKVKEEVVTEKEEEEIKEEFTERSIYREYDSDDSEVSIKRRKREVKRSQKREQQMGGDRRKRVKTNKIKILKHSDENDKLLLELYNKNNGQWRKIRKEDLPYTKNAAKMRIQTLLHCEDEYTREELLFIEYNGDLKNTMELINSHVPDNEKVKLKWKDITNELNNKFRGAGKGLRQEKDVRSQYVNAIRRSRNAKWTEDDNNVILHAIKNNIPVQKIQLKKPSRIITHIEEQYNILKNL